MLKIIKDEYSTEDRIFRNGSLKEGFNEFLKSNKESLLEFSSIEKYVQIGYTEKNYIAQSAFFIYKEDTEIKDKILKKIPINKETSLTLLIENPVGIENNELEIHLKKINPLPIGDEIELSYIKKKSTHNQKLAHQILAQDIDIPYDFETYWDKFVKISENLNKSLKKNIKKVLKKKSSLLKKRVKYSLVLKKRNKIIQQKKLEKKNYKNRNKGKER